MFFLLADYEVNRLKLAEAMGCQTVDLNSLAG